MKPDLTKLSTLSMMAIFFLVGILSGCASLGLEYAPKGRFLYYHKELPASERAVEAARQAGKNTECPDEFRAVEKMKNDAYEMYTSCRDNEAIAMAVEVAKEGAWVREYYSSDPSVEVASFFVNSINDVSSTPSVSHPSSGSEVTVLTPELIVFAFVGTIVMGLIAGIYPSWRASTLQPIESIRGSE